MTRRFTARQGEYLAFIHGFITRHGVAPSFEEMAAHFGVSTPSINGMIKTLEREGFISRIHGAARSLRVEVPPDELPDIGYGKPKGRKQAAASREPGVSVETIAIGTASAVLDAVMPVLDALRPSVDLVEKAMVQAAKNLDAALARAGVPEQERLGISRAVVAQFARWNPEGKGVVVRKRVWTKR